MHKTIIYEVQYYIKLFLGKYAYGLIVKFFIKRKKSDVVKSNVIILE